MEQQRTLENRVTKTRRSVQHLWRRKITQTFQHFLSVIEEVLIQHYIRRKGFQLRIQNQFYCSNVMHRSNLWKGNCLPLKHILLLLKCFLLTMTKCSITTKSNKTRKHGQKTFFSFLLTCCYQSFNLCITKIHCYSNYSDECRNQLR